MTQTNFTVASGNLKSRKACLSILPIYYTPTSQDVICAKGKDAMQNPGNLFFRKLLAENVEAYKSATNRMERSNIVSRIEKIIKKRGSLFVRQHKGRWADIGSRNAREKIGANIRDLLPEHYQSSTKAKAACRFVKKITQAKKLHQGQPSLGYNTSTGSLTGGDGSQGSDSESDTSSYAKNRGYLSHKFKAPRPSALGPQLTPQYYRDLEKSREANKFMHLPKFQELVQEEEEEEEETPAPRDSSNMASEHSVLAPQEVFSKFEDPQANRGSDNQKKYAFEAAELGRGRGKVIPSLGCPLGYPKGTGRGTPLVPAPAQGLPLFSRSVFNLIDLPMRKSEWAAANKLRAHLAVPDRTPSAA